MRIIAFSDSHGNYGALYRAAKKHEADGELFVHLGDGEREFQKLAQVFPHKEMVGVSGNCDWSASGGIVELIRAEGHKILITHGHTFYVKSSINELLATARGLNASLVMFGHTHIAVSEYKDGIYLFNPGSVSRPGSGAASYGIVDVTKDGIAVNIAKI